MTTPLNTTTTSSHIDTTTTTTTTTSSSLSSSSLEKGGVRLTFGFFDPESQPLSSVLPPSPRTDSFPTPTSDPISVSIPSPVMHQLFDVPVSAPVVSDRLSTAMLFFSPTSSSSTLKRSATTKSLSKPGASHHPLLIPGGGHPLRGRSSSLNSSITFSESLDHRSMTRVRSTSFRSNSIRSTRPRRAPQTISPSMSTMTLCDNDNAMISTTSTFTSFSSPQDPPLPMVPLPNINSGRDSVVAFLSSPPVRSRVAVGQQPLSPRCDGAVDMVVGALRPSASAPSLILQPSGRRLVGSNSLRLGGGGGGGGGTGHNPMKRRSSSFIENFDSVRNDYNKIKEFDAFSRMSLDDNDYNDYPYDSHVHDKSYSTTIMTTTPTTTTAATVTAAATTTLETKKTKKIKLWYPTLSMFGFMMKSRKEK